MEHIDVPQNSDAWKAARIGYVGASRIADLMAKTKTGPAASRENLKAQIVTEIMTGVPQGPDLSNNSAVQWGVETESAARAAYEVATGNMVQECGFFRHGSIERTGASPDGLIGEDGVLEIKCPNTLTHFEYLKSGKPPTKYLLQMLWQMECTGRKWGDFVSYDPRLLPRKCAMMIVRVQRDDEKIGEIKTEMMKFLEEVKQQVKELEDYGG